MIQRIFYIFSQRQCRIEGGRALQGVTMGSLKIYNVNISDSFHRNKFKWYYVGLLLLPCNTTVLKRSNDRGFSNLLLWVLKQCTRSLYKKWPWDFAIPSLDYSIFLCILLSFLVVNLSILQNKFGPKRYWLVLVQFCNWQGELLIEMVTFLV